MPHIHENVIPFLMEAMVFFLQRRVAAFIGDSGIKIREAAGTMPVAERTRLPIKLQRLFDRPLAAYPFGIASGELRKGRGVISILHSTGFQSNITPGFIWDGLRHLMPYSSSRSSRFAFQDMKQKPI